MKWPSRRKSLPNGTVSWTSTSWNAEANFSSCRADRMWNPQSAVSSSISASEGTRGVADGGGLAPSVILAAANDRLIFRALRLHRSLERAKQVLRLVAV